MFVTDRRRVTCCGTAVARSALCYFIVAAYDNLTAARVKTELFPTRLPIKNSAVEKWRRNMRHYFLTTKRQSAFGTWT